MGILNSPEFLNSKFAHKVTSNKRKFSHLHYHKDYELYYLAKGTTMYLIDDNFYHIKEGVFVIIPPNTLHNTDSLSCKHIERFLFGFSLKLFNSKLSCIVDDLCSKKVLSLSPTRMEQAVILMEKIELENIEQSETSDYLIDLYLQELLIYLYKYGQEYKVKKTNTETLIDSITQYIKANFADELTLKKLGKHFSISPSHLSRIFKETTGVGINEYIIFTRIDNASKLLKTTSLPITKIAFRCGFNDSNYFSTIFKKYKGTSPLKYANKHKQTSIDYKKPG